MNNAYCRRRCNPWNLTILVSWYFWVPLPEESPPPETFSPSHFWMVKVGNSILFPPNYFFNSRTSRSYEFYWQRFCRNGGYCYGGHFWYWVGILATKKPTSIPLVDQLGIWLRSLVYITGFWKFIKNHRKRPNHQLVFSGPFVGHDYLWTTFCGDDQGLEALKKAAGYRGMSLFDWSGKLILLLI